MEKLASCPLIRWNRLLANLAIKWSSGTRIRELDRNHFLIFWSEFERRKSPLSTAASYFELSYNCCKNNS